MGVEMAAASSPEAAARRPSPLLRLLAMVTIPLVVLDQASKLFVKSHMALYETIPIVRNYLDITYTLNPGAAFSFLAEASPMFREGLLVVLAAVAIVVLTVILARSEHISVTSVAFAMILAGASGNLIDRAVRGRVIDFIRAHYYDANFPIFNVADSAITIGVALVILASFFELENEPSSPRAD